jgi:hypothetical protein
MDEQDAANIILMEWGNFGDTMVQVILNKLKIPSAMV